MTDTERVYDAAFDKKDYYDQIVASLNDTLTAVFLVGDKEFDTQGLVDQLTHAQDKAKEYAAIMDKCVRCERASSKAGIGFYD